MAKSSEPKLKELSVTVSMGGKVTIVKFDHSSEWFISKSRTFGIPEDWTTEEAKEFQERELQAMREEMDAQDTLEYEERFEQSFMNKG